MINIYIKNKEKKELGFCFYLFENEQFVMDYDVYGSEFKMNEYLEKSKCDILGINIERFIIFCEKNMLSKTILTEESLENLKKATRWRVKHVYDYKKFLQLIDRGEALINNLISSQNEESMPKALMMGEVIKKFVKSELEETI